MRIELRTSPGCPNAEPMRKLVAGCLAELGIGDPVIELVGRYPSPTLSIDGIDVMRHYEDSASDVCRLDLPTHQRVLEALRAAQP
jgi:hypothetical protein